MSHRQAGRLAGTLFLAVFLLYGVGSTLAPQPAGLTLMVLNSAGVATIGAIAFRLLRTAAPRTALVYVLARITEAVALAIGVLFLAGGNAEANQAAYVAAMVVLGVGSVPFCLALARHRVAPRWLSMWGVVGYVLLAVGVGLDSAVPGAGVALAVPGGLFELTLGVLLLVRGWPTRAPTVTPSVAATQ
ncbi:DUF4386 domain-containing protein [Promicromonospora vindobonensis]|uniref:DUF4386 domain-containing protein n=1 Tax=Promicromonospora vindobonensis TaxID=195748 RepID=A0ABW5VYY2_9MICO